MERPRQPERRERTGILQIALIGATLAAVIAGGVHLLARTHDAWERRYGEQAPSPQPASEPLPRVLPEAVPDREYAQMLKDKADGKLRCINGQLFRRLDNGWENIPDATCEQVR